MKRVVFHLCMIVVGLAMMSCKQTNQQSGNAYAATNTTSATNGAVINAVANVPAAIYAKPEVPVLCYHRIADDKKGEFAVTPATFTSHLKILADSGYHSISPAQLYDYLVYDKPLPSKPVMITFDDSRVEHSVIAAPLLEKFGFRGVFFIMTITYNKTNYMTTDQIARLAQAGHTIGLHSWDHTMATKYKDAADWQKQVVAPKSKLESIVGKTVDYWAYPNGVCNHEAAAELSKYFKLSFILSTKRDSTLPLQTIRRIIVPEWSAQGLLRSMHQTFEKNIYAHTLTISKK
ncbi:MAG TPA: polysaccharide deacetylase family protein [Bacteroidota bacterium]|nr:polysaccharide deacetylase family protein [Bacteroidota bacterium]